MEITYREDAHKSLAANPFFAAWDPRVLDAYVEHGLVAAPSSGVRLAMPALQEALAFAGTSSGAPVWDMLPTLEERIPLRWVVPGRPGEPECVVSHSPQRSINLLLSFSFQDRRTECYAGARVAATS